MSTVSPTASAATVLHVDRALVRAGDVVDLLVQLARGVEPALDDLDPVEIGAVGVAQRAHHELGCLALGGGFDRSPPIGTPRA